MTNNNNDPLFEAFKSDFEMMAANHPGIVLELTAIEAWLLFSNLQLALRHPLNGRPSADLARQIARQIETAIATTPALAEIARRGWIAKYDQPAGRQPARQPKRLN